MGARLNQIVSRVFRPSRRAWLIIGLTPFVVVAGASWWLTEPLIDPGAPGSARPVAIVPAPAEIKARVAPTWPEGRLDGLEAKKRLLDILTVASERVNQIEAYTATFRRQERIKGKLGPEQTLAMKVRQRPFAVYFKFLSPQAGREVVYAEGHHDNKLIAHAAGVARLLLPRLAVPPDHPLALADARHPVTEGGIANLTARLLKFRHLDLTDTDAETVLDRTTDSEGRPWLRSIHRHTIRSAERPFALIEVLYDPATFFPVDIRNFDWPEPGQSGAFLLAEHYHYEDLVLDAPLSELDFDPANPAYAFHRF